VLKAVISNSDPMKKVNSFNSIIIILLFVFAFSCKTTEEEYHIQTVEIPKGYTLEQKIKLSGRVLPHPRQMLWWEDAFKGFIHFGPNTFTGMEWGTGFEDAALFNPTELDTDQWCKLMKAAGMTRVVMVVKHHEGFCLWQTRYTDHSVASSPWQNGQGDVLRELAESCEKYGIRLGVYLSPADLYQMESPKGYYGNGSEFTERTIPRQVDGRPFEDQRTFTYLLDDYNEYFMNQLFELLTEYGPIYDVWFDGANPKPGTGQTYAYNAWYDMIRELAPDAVIFGKGPDSRWCGNEGGATREAEYNIIPLNISPDTYDWPDRTETNIAGRKKITEQTGWFHYMPAETNTSIRHGWFWRNEHEQQVRSVDDVFDIYERSVGGNSQFHLNIPPDNRGLFAERDAKVLTEVGKIIRKVYDTNLLEGSSSSANNVLDGNMDTWWQAPASEAILEVTLPEKRIINRFMIKEAIAQRGERVEEHYLEARINGEWQRIVDGKTIGHKRILRFPAVETDAFRLHITMSRLAPAIAHISAHYYDEPPKPVRISREENGMLSMGVGTSFSWKDHGTADLTQNIYYTTDGSEPGPNSALYTEPISLPLGGHIRARSIVEDRNGPVSETRLGILRNNWTATDSKGRTEEPSRVLNGNTQSRWISDEADKGPFSITIDMHNLYEIAGLKYIPNTDGGYIESYQVEVSTDSKIWQKIHRGTFGNIINDPGERIVLFSDTQQARYVKLSDIKPPGSFNRVGAAEIEVLAGKQ
jgi:alpha-L-fucosidase